MNQVLTRIKSLNLPPMWLRYWGAAAMLAGTVTSIHSILALTDVFVLALPLSKIRFLTISNSAFPILGYAFAVGLARGIFSLALLQGLATLLYASWIFFDSKKLNLAWLAVLVVRLNMFAALVVIIKAVVDGDVFKAILAFCFLPLQVFLLTSVPRLTKDARTTSSFFASA